MTDLNASITLRLIDQVSGSATKISKGVQTLAVKLEQQTAAANRIIAGSSDATRAAVASARVALQELTGVSPRVGQVASAALDDVIASGQLSEQQIREVAAESARLAKINAEQVTQLRALAKSEGLLAGQAKTALRQLGREASQALKQMVAANTAAASSGERTVRTMRTTAAAAAGTTASLAQATTRTAKAARLQERNLVGVTRASQNQGREVGLLVNTFSELGFSLFAAIPGMQQLGTQMAIMGGSAFQLGAFLGLPGAALGVLIGVVPTMVSTLGLFDDAAEETGKKVESLATRFQSLASAIESSRSEAERRGAALRGEGTEAEQEALVQQQRERAGQLNARAQEILQDVVGSGRTAALGFREVTAADRGQVLRSVRDALQADPFASDEDLLARIGEGDRRSLIAQGRGRTTIGIQGAIDQEGLAELRAIAAQQIEAEAEVAQAERLREQAVAFRSRQAQIEKEKSEDPDQRNRGGPRTPDTLQRLSGDAAAARAAQTTLPTSGPTIEEQVERGAERGMERALRAQGLRVFVEPQPGAGVTGAEGIGPTGVTLDQVPPI